MDLRLHKLDVDLVSSANSLSHVYLMLMRIQIFNGSFMLQNSPDMNLLCENFGDLLWCSFGSLISSIDISQSSLRSLKKHLSHRHNISFCKYLLINHENK